MSPTSVRCLILACGNTLRGDDGAGPWLAEWAEDRFSANPDVRIIARPQWTPELAEEVAGAESVLFIDCAIDAAPGAVRLRPVEPAAAGLGLATHHTGAPELLALGLELYDSLPNQAMLLTVGAGSTELREGFSAEVAAALPDASSLLEETVLRFLAKSDPSQRRQR
jgi:hydrogenase maturation protease